MILFLNINQKYFYLNSLSKKNRFYLYINLYIAYTLHVLNILMENATKLKKKVNVIK